MRREAWGISSGSAELQFGNGAEGSTAFCFRQYA